MQRRFKVMLAMEDEEGRGTLTPLLHGHIDLEVASPTDNNLPELKASAKALCGQVQTALTPDATLVAMNKLLLGNKG